MFDDYLKQKAEDENTEFVEFTPEGKKVKYKIAKSVINSKRRFTYEEVLQMDLAFDHKEIFELALKRKLL